MEKLIFSMLFLITLSSHINAKGKEQILAYKIISDEFDKSIPEGKYVIEGKIYLLNSKNLIKKVSIKTQNAEKFSSVDGSFKLQLTADGDWISFDKSNYQTTYFENYKVKPQHRIKIEIFMEKQGEIKEIPCEKPVIYVYNSNPIDFTIQLNPTGELFFTYPELPKNNTWEMKISEKGQLFDQKGNEYPYLFWEAMQNKNPDLIRKNQLLEGEIVEKNHVISFLDSTLSSMNFNSKEKADFITYWGPRLIQHNYNFIRFVVQEDANQFAHYEINPKPSSFNRFYILFTGFEEFPAELKSFTQNLKPFFRSGFDILEWGGMELDEYTIF
jgi:hypothetical protein